MSRIVTARWRDWQGEGVEHLVLRERADGVGAEAVVVGRSDDGTAFAAAYRIDCDAGWRVRRVEVSLTGSRRRLDLESDGRGSWRDAGGAEVPELRGAVDVDLSASPFTNTLPIRRLSLAPGASAEILVAYVRFPDLALMPDRQRYTCLEAGRIYRYEAVDGDFVREIEVDDDGLVVTYPGLFRRVEA